MNEFEGLIGTESETLVALNLKRGEVEKTRGELFAFLLCYICDCKFIVLDDFKQFLAIFLEFELTLGRRKKRVAVEGFKLPVWLRFEIVDFILAVDDEGKSRGLHPSDREDFTISGISTAILEAIEPRGIHSEQPVANRTAESGFVESLELG